MLDSLSPISLLYRRHQNDEREGCYTGCHSQARSHTDCTPTEPTLAEAPTRPGVKAIDSSRHYNDCFCFHCRPSPIYLCHSGLHHNLQLDPASRSNNRPDPILSTHQPMDLHIKHVSVGPCIHVYVDPCTDPALTLASKTDRYLSAFGAMMKPTVPEMKGR